VRSVPPPAPLPTTMTSKGAPSSSLALSKNVRAGSGTSIGVQLPAGKSTDRSSKMCGPVARSAAAIRRLGSRWYWPSSMNLSSTSTSGCGRGTEACHCLFRASYVQSTSSSQLALVRTVIRLSSGTVMDR